MEGVVQAGCAWIKYKVACDVCYYVATLDESRVDQCTACGDAWHTEAGSKGKRRRR